MTEHGDFSELLTDRDRILMAAWTLPNDGPLTDTQRRQALANFADCCKRWDVTYAQVGRQVNKPRGTLIGDLVKGVYRDGSDTHIRTLNNWVEQYARQKAVKLQGKFVQTRVATHINSVARLVIENHTMGLVFGPTGIGKTRCAQALYQTYVGSILLTVRFGAYHPKGLTTLLAQALGVRTVSVINESAKHLTQLERVLNKLEDTNRLIIVDEGHKLNDGALELLREIHDATRCPVLLLATKDLHDRIVRSATPDAGQIRSRFDIDWPLTQGHDMHAGGKPLFTIEEIRKLYQQTPIRLSADGANYLKDIANTLGYGSLRRCGILLINAARRARKRNGIAEDKDVTVTADDLAFVETKMRPDVSEQQAIKDRRQAAGAAQCA